MIRKIKDEPQTEYLSADILEKVALCAERDRQNGRMIPHERVFEILSSRFGWK